MEKRDIKHTVRLRSIHHRGARRLGVFFSYDDDLISLIKTLPGIRYSSSRRCWHLPDRPDAREAIEKLPRVSIQPQTTQELVTGIGTSDAAPSIRDSSNIETSAIAAEISPSVSATREPAVATDIVAKTAKIKIRYSANHFHIYFQYQPDLVSQIKRLKRSWWSPQGKHWIAWGCHENLSRLQELFAIWSEAEYTQVEELIGLYIGHRRLVIYRLPDQKEEVAVQLQGGRMDQAFVKSFPSRRYDRAYKRWIIRNDPVLIDRILTHYRAQGVEIVNRLPSAETSKPSDQPNRAARQARLLSKFSDARQRALVKSLTDRLIQMRYSWSTIRAYVRPVLAFQAWLGEDNIASCCTEDVNAYLAHLSALKVSDSQVHRHVNALKFYFEKVILNVDIDLGQVKRPKKSFTLPRVLSKEEVQRMILTTENIKHRTILFALYSSGLRLAELLALRIDDVAWDRDQLWVRAGKGRKDRVVPLSKVLKSSLHDYCAAYKPVQWLFEGRKAGQPYSPRSIQQVVRQAAKRAHISHRVTPHTLRHCFATHLLDGGVSIKLIQELLGHKDVKTTMIYAHVTTETLMSVKSPLDTLDLSKKTKS